MSKKILFVCRGNVARSQMGEAWLKYFDKEHKFEVLSAGTKLSGPEQPIGELAPAIDNVIDVMKEEGIDVSKNIRKEVNKEMAEKADKIILIVDDRDPIPDYLSNSSKIIRWSVLDPKGQTLEFTRRTRDQIKGLVENFVKNESLI